MIWYVAFGSAVGGAARYALSGLLQRLTATTFPVGTFVINVSGSFLLAFLLRVALRSPSVTPELRLALTTGFCGGFTTLSTFSYEAMALIESGAWPRATAYVLGSVLGSLAGALLGILLARLIARGGA